VHVESDCCAVRFHTAACRPSSCSANLTACLVLVPSANHEWTTWFNVDHPGGRGDYEQLEAIRFYYRSRVCPVPRALEARTTDWVPARETGETVHADPTVGFWCLNEEQGPGRNCSNYSVRFLCPKGRCDQWYRRLKLVNLRQDIVAVGGFHSQKNKQSQ
jgi:hypothetical protein